MENSELHRAERRPSANAAYGGSVIDDEHRVLLREPKGTLRGIRVDVRQRRR